MLLLSPSFSPAPQQCCIFDLDHTLFKTNSTKAFGFYLYKRHFYSLSTLAYCLCTYALHRYGLLSLSTLYTKLFRKVLLDKPLSALLPHVAAFYQSYLQELLSPIVCKHLKIAQQQGIATLLLSASPAFLVEPVATALSFDGWAGTDSISNVQGHCIGFSLPMDGERKRLFAMKWLRTRGIAPENVTVYSDSILDLPLLEWAGHKFLVDPDRKLARIALERGWNIINH